MCSCSCTSVVNIRRDLYVTQLCVDWHFVEVFIFLQTEVSSQRQWVPVLIHLVDQHGVKVFKLERTAKEEQGIDYVMIQY